ncbi:MAG: hypothetical protein QNJ22_13635 [Desulfosarcinaceae bacterium]|nr:hypothetical protein [Desulfosarcinaceae bacterium]
MKRVVTRKENMGFGSGATLALILLTVLAVEAGAVEAPRHLGGFQLGEQIETCEELVDMDTCLHVRYMEYIQEAEIRAQPGFKSGLIGFGTCADPGKILRIKLKYTDGSKRFFNEMMKRLRQRYGEPDEYKGDPFHVLVAWKWSFEDAAGNRISLTMQHNTKDVEQKMGNAIKLSLISQIDKERRCFEAKQPDAVAAGVDGGGKGAGRKGYQADDWKRFVPY